MRSDWRLLISLLLLSSLLIHEAQGIRLLKGNTPADKQHKIQNDENKPKPEGSSPTREKTAKKEENMSVNPSSTTSVTDQQRQPEMYPDILDIAGMDYSQARRKPPIHN